MEDNLDLFSTDEPLADGLATTHHKTLAEVRTLIKALKGDQAKLVLEALVENPIQKKVKGLDKKGLKVYHKSIALRTMLFQLASYSSIKEAHKEIE
jgi:hypothetical protein